MMWRSWLALWFFIRVAGIYSRIFGRILRQNLRWAYSTTLPETNSLPLKIKNQRLEDDFQGQSGPIFRGELLVSGKIGMFHFFCRRFFDSTILLLDHLILSSGDSLSFFPLSSDHGWHPRGFARWPSLPTTMVEGSRATCLC